jgi:hypothetical protein
MFLTSSTRKMRDREWEAKRLELIGMSSMIDGETSVEALRDLVGDLWRRPRKSMEEVYPKIYIGSE